MKIVNEMRRRQSTRSIYALSKRATGYVTLTEFISGGAIIRIGVVGGVL